jgi:hypothetical protein
MSFIYKSTSNSVTSAIMCCNRITFKTTYVDDILLSKMLDELLVIVTPSSILIYNEKIVIFKTISFKPNNADEIIQDIDAFTNLIICITNTTIYRIESSGAIESIPLKCDKYIIIGEFLFIDIDSTFTRIVDIVTMEVLIPKNEYVHVKHLRKTENGIGIIPYSQDDVMYEHVESCEGDFLAMMIDGTKIPDIEQHYKVDIDCEFLIGIIDNLFIRYKNNYLELYDGLRVIRGMYFNGNYKLFKLLDKIIAWDVRHINAEDNAGNAEDISGSDIEIYDFALFYCKNDNPGDVRSRLERESVKMLGTRCMKRVPVVK